MSGLPQDDAIRREALDPARSFIVQAPAGSGKTELLTRRVLSLLVTVEEPEQILAITFTRKAAREMRERVVGLLQQASRGENGASVHEQEGLALAQAAIEHDRQRGWGLLDNPQRLNLRTIDGLCTQLAYRLPVVSELGAPVGVATEAWPLYQEAARRCLAVDPTALDRVLLHVGNRLQRVEALLASMLATRDQWMRYVGVVLDPKDWRDKLEGHLAELVGSRLELLRKRVPQSLVSELLACTLQARANRRGLGLEPADVTRPSQALPETHAQRPDEHSEIESPWERLYGLQEPDGKTVLPGVAQTDLATWVLLADAVLTNQGECRKPGGLTRKFGIPTSKADCQVLEIELAEARAFKARYGTLCESLSSMPELAALLHEIRQLPATGYSDDDWALLVQLLERMPALNGFLNQVFAEQHRIDFIEIAARAGRALGSAEEPTDLALAMDLRLRHLLVDEFQDTSQSQFDFLSLLVAGWLPDEGRTFFAVGDPMQSIYRFRNADVSLFTRARESGIGPVQLEALTLSVNFRAVPAVVEWVNQTFEPLFPTRPDLESGAVPYAPGQAHQAGQGGARVHPLLDMSADDEAEHVARLAAEALASQADGNVAILVRSRSHAQPILAALQQADVACQAVEMDLLGERPVVRDLVSLCLALRFAHDRLHWLAVLRAPWCGLSLADLQILVNDSKSAPVIELMADEARLTAMSEDGQVRLARVQPILEQSAHQAARDDFVTWLEAAWVQLGGPAISREPRDLMAVSRALDTLRALELENRLWQPSAVFDALNKLYADDAGNQAARLQIMTLHKSKGLEFDTVIVPFLSKRPRSNDTRLLEWFESGDEQDGMLLLAPFGEVRSDSSPILKLVHAARKRCDQQELLRLLYVACTRARRHLHLVATVTTRADGHVKQPAAQTLLAPLWPVFQRALSNGSETPAECSGAGDAAASAASHGTGVDDVEVEFDAQAPGESETVEPPPLLERLPNDWRATTAAAFVWPEIQGSEADLVDPDPDPDVDEWDPAITHAGEPDTPLEFRWAGPRARQIGTVAHQQMQYLANQAQLKGLDKLPDLIESRAGVVQRQLQGEGMPGRDCELAAVQVLQAMQALVNDERGRWTIDPMHAEAHSEWAVSVPGVAGNPSTTRPGSTPVQQVVMDRVFIDAEGVRWIVDYKMSRHEGAAPDAFLDRERKRYASQLQRYADIMQRIESRPCRAGLYFPLMGGWREVTLTGPDSYK